MNDVVAAGHCSAGYRIVLPGSRPPVGVGVDGSDLGQRAAVGDVDLQCACTSATHTSDVIAGESYSQAR
jgi:hypothetical protein